MREPSGYGNLIDRYVYQVSRFLFVKNKADIEQEIRALIEDMLAARVGEKDSSEEDVKAVLKELGNPIDLAAKYNESKRYLIGPALFPFYWRVLLIFLSIGTGAQLISILVSALSGAFHPSLLGGLLTTAFGMFAAVTLAFALIEHQGVRVSALFSDELPNTLPPVPEKRNRIPRSEPIVNLCFGLAFLLLVAFVPQVFGFYRADTKTMISIFNVDVLHSILYLFILSFLAEAVADTLKLIDGRYTIRVLTVTAVTSILSTILTWHIVMHFPIWNSAFPAQLTAFFPTSQLPAGAENWGTIASNVIFGLALFGTVVSICKAAARAFNGENESGAAT